MDLKELKLKGGSRKNMKIKVKQEKGITLIALVVTIVVLLILAVVSINAIFNENGLIKKAQEAQNKMDQATENDKKELNNMNEWIENVTGKKTEGGDEPQISETWVLNETLNLGTTAWSYNIEFSSNGVTGNVFSHHYIADSKAPDGGVLTDNLWYGDDTGDGAPVYINNAWPDEAYRTITFSTSPTGDLLTWLQQIGTKQ